MTIEKRKSDVMTLAIQSSREFDEIEEIVTRLFGQLKNKTEEDDPHGFYTGPDSFYSLQGTPLVCLSILKFHISQSISREYQV